MVSETPESPLLSTRAPVPSASRSLESPLAPRRSIPPIPSRASNSDQEDILGTPTMVSPSTNLGCLSYTLTLGLSPCDITNNGVRHSCLFHLPSGNTGMHGQHTGTSIVTHRESERCCPPASISRTSEPYEETFEEQESRLAEEATLQTNISSSSPDEAVIPSHCP